MKKTIRALLIAGVMVVLLATPVLAVTFSSQLTVTEDNGTSYTMLAVSHPAENTWMAANGFMLASALDTRVETFTGAALPHLVADGKVLFASVIPGLADTNLYYTTSETPLTAMNIVLGDDGYFTIADATFPELGNEFEIEIDTCYPDGVLAYKPEACKAWFPSTGDVLAMIYDAAASNLINENTNNASVEINTGNRWFAQVFTTPAGGIELTKWGLYLRNGYGGDGVMDVSLRAVAGGVPTGADLAGTTTVTETPDGGVFSWVDVAELYSLESSTQYAIVCHWVGGAIEIGIATTNPYAGGTECTSADGTTWSAVAANDFTFRVNGKGAAVLVSAAAVPSGSSIKVTTDTTDLVLYVDDVEEDSAALGGASVPNTANDWVLLDDVPYAAFVKISVGGTLIAHYQPITMIQGTVLPDREGAAQNGAITWGTNPAGITVTTAAMTSSGQPGTVSSGFERPRDILGNVGEGDHFLEPTGLTGNPFYGIIHGIGEHTPITDAQGWYIFGLITMLIIMGIMFLVVPNHLFFAAIACVVWDGYLISQTIWPFWTLTIFVLLLIGSLTMERSPSI